MSTFKLLPTAGFTKSVPSPVADSVHSFHESCPSIPDYRGCWETVFRRHKVLVGLKV